MGQLSVVPRSSGNPCAVDCHTEFSTTNRKWRHCFSVQVRSTILTVLARLTLQEKKARHMQDRQSLVSSRTHSPPLNVSWRGKIGRRARTPKDRLRLRRKPFFFVGEKPFFCHDKSSTFNLYLLFLINIITFSNYSFYFTSFYIYLMMEFHFR